MDEKKYKVCDLYIPIITFLSYISRYLHLIWLPDQWLTQINIPGPNQYIELCCFES